MKIRLADTRGFCAGVDRAIEIVKKVLEIEDINDALPTIEKVQKEFNTKAVVVKAQIHAGGRGKGGGVKYSPTTDIALKNTKEMLGMNLVTHQTGEEGQKVRKVYITQALDIKNEYYCAITLDRSQTKDVFMVSSEGGVEIEKVAEETPEKIIKVWIDPLVGMKSFHAMKLANGLGLTGEAYKTAIKVFIKMYKCYMGTDASIVEINPLVLTETDEIVALDAKFNFDGNAMFRHKDIVELRDTNEEDPTELEASKYDLNYIALDGEIGCMVNGAGLAMATMDIIKLYGAEPANFLDVGGGATKEKVTEAFKIITSDPQVKGILVNIFGGIMRCDVIADGVVSAVKEVGLTVPLVVRLEGTNVDEGKRIITESGLNVIAADNLRDGAEKIVAAVKAL